MTLVKKGWSSPFSNKFLTDFFNADKLFDEDDFLKVERMPAVNIVENDTTFEVEVAVPGMKKEDFKVEVKDGMLIISAEKEEKKEEVKKNYTRKEFSVSAFSRMFTLPENVKESEIDAEYKNGVLHMIIPKKEPVVSSAKKVAIK